MKKLPNFISQSQQKNHLPPPPPERLLGNFFEDLYERLHASSTKKSELKIIHKK